MFLDEGRNKRKHGDTLNFKDRQINHQGSDDELDEGNERKLSRQNDGLKSKISDNANNTGRFQGIQSDRTPLDVRALTPNTAEMRGYQAMRQELDHGDSIDSRHSIRYYNGDLTNRSQRTDELELSQSFMSYQISPRYKNSDQYRRQAVGEKPEAWLVFPDGRVPVNGSRLEDYPSPRGRVSINDYPSPRAKMSINDYPSPRGRVSINDYPSPRVQMSRNDYPGPPRRLQLEPEKGLARAFPVNFASSVGSALKASFTNINGVRDTPVEEFNTDEERLVQGSSKQENRKRCPTWIWVFLICLGLVLLSGLLIAIVYGIVAATDASSSSLISRIQPGPGNNSPCNDYVALTERWRRITGLGPSQTGDPFNCDRDFQERWYRFDGDAGTVLADQSSPPSWEDCGTSRVGWLAGSHPDIRDGTVNRTLCVTAFGGNCEVKMTNGQVRGCPDPRGGIFYVYYLLRPGISCNWGYCALGPPS
ncbi:uncharacterized protein LOC111713504 [Eurytemora carolleeae]|uniref:uncharacterized protein LOC111713504 n=1 Tax=Eurytemora carolleeae TaxID=1294199 RepID=UPI000C778516|nr:uncharacterized protein LOC111713504 [Eurytemora carolleeae]|eukprot:XP_023344139.1 uncharacterized protein LOC111713504 [Eurytemora affinis]